MAQVGVVKSGTANHDVMTGGSGNDTIYGLGGNDSIEAGAGNDWLIGGTGTDTYVFAPGSGNDLIIGDTDNGNDILYINTNYDPTGANGYYFSHDKDGNDMVFSFLNRKMQLTDSIRI